MADQLVNGERNVVNMVLLVMAHDGFGGGQGFIMEEEHKKMYQ